jgi:hypothetical protein
LNQQLESALGQTPRIRCPGALSRHDSFLRDNKTTVGDDSSFTFSVGVPGPS